MSRGSLLIAGTGIKVVGHVTLETRTLFERATTLADDPFPQLARAHWDEFLRALVREQHFVRSSNR